MPVRIHRLNNRVRPTTMSFQYDSDQVKNNSIEECGVKCKGEELIRLLNNPRFASVILSYITTYLDMVCKAKRKGITPENLQKVIDEINLKLRTDIIPAIENEKDQESKENFLSKLRWVQALLREV